MISLPENCSDIRRGHDHWRTAGHTGALRSIIRRPAVAGYYYPENAAALADTIRILTTGTSVTTKALGVIVPHGSYQRAGAIVGQTLAGVRIPRCCVLLGPSHTGSPLSWSLMPSGTYRTPLGDVPINTEIADTLLRSCDFLTADSWAQPGEHALEVLVPFLQRLGPEDLSVAPLIINSDDEQELRCFGETLAELISHHPDDLLVIASSDLSHYLPLERATKEDRSLLQQIELLDPDGLIRTVRDHRSSMCGYAAVACLLFAARVLKSSRTVLVSYTTSAVTGSDPDSVTGYAGLTIQ